MRIIYIDRPADSPRADLFKCNLHWQDDSTLLITWADQIKVARIRARQRSSASPSNLSPLIVEITAVFQLDCMIAGIVPHSLVPHPEQAVRHHQPHHSRSSSVSSTQPTPSLTAFLIVAYTPPDSSLLAGNEAASTAAEQARKAADRPELRIISRAGEELAADALSIPGYERWGCNDYMLVEVPARPAEADSGCYVVMSPKDVVVVRPRDWRDHVSWLVDRKRYEEALEAIERRSEDAAGKGEKGKDSANVDAVEIGQKYIEHLVAEGNVVYPLAKSVLMAWF